jgi:hypothetical protein
LEETPLPHDMIDEDRMVNRLIWRLMPLLTIMFLVSFIDRQRRSICVNSDDVRLSWLPR